ncbi:apolipoprotein N-acyltransferase [Thalassomonas sp. RHCl1]|uniref:apolipoprotein N-acyltransferase n=1 Tax=Thalassomonas sp. RHCl1 TaxID=2995320 RepID=UPI00248D307E|nr:apolipoprotein N-acyltransferase [Thalassomonas sp. RHCl1]
MLRRLGQRLLANLKDKTNWLSFLAGLSLVLAYAPLSLWYLAIIIPALWLRLMVDRPAKDSAKQGFIFGLGWFTSGISWVHVSIDQFGGLPLIVSLLLMLLLCGYLALYPALSCYLSARLTAKRQFSLWLLPPFWLLGEYLRSVMLTGFPWLSLGYSQIDGPLAAFAPVIGETGITFVMLCLSIALLQLSRRIQIKRHLALLAVLAISGFILSQQTWVTPTGKSVKVALVQANIKQELKWLPEQEWPSMLKFLDLTRVNYDADIIIWPESAVPAIESTAQDFLEVANKGAALNNSAIITGIINYNFEARTYFNSLIVLGRKQNEDEQGSYYYNSSNRYYKNHLLPIGEFVPFQELLRPLAPLFNLPMSSFSRGNYVQPNLVAKELALLPLICFEIAFPHQLAANLTRDTDMILTVSNDAWFGDSHGPHQHLEIARMRALEFGRPVLRSTNNGITATIDHSGKITSRIPQFEEAVLRDEVKLQQGFTPYSQWGRYLQYLLPLLSLLIYFAVGKFSPQRQEKLSPPAT